MHKCLTTVLRLTHRLLGFPNFPLYLMPPTQQKGHYYLCKSWRCAIQYDNQCERNSRNTDRGQRRKSVTVDAGVQLICRQHGASAWLLTQCRLYRLTDAIRPEPENVPRLFRLQLWRL